MYSRICSRHLGTFQTRECIWILDVVKDLERNIRASKLHKVQSSKSGPISIPLVQTSNYVLLDRSDRSTTFASSGIYRLGTVVP